MWVVSMKLMPYQPSDVYNFEVGPRFFFNLFTPDYGTYLDNLLYVSYVNHISKINYFWAFVSEDFSVFFSLRK